MQIITFDLLRGQHVAVHPGSDDPNPPHFVNGEFRWADGTPDSGLIDWGLEISGEAPRGERKG